MTTENETRPEPARMCDVEGCAEDAVTEVDGRLRLNPQGQTRNLWIAVEFALCKEHETEHDKFHGELVGMLPEPHGGRGR